MDKASSEKTPLEKLTHVSGGSERPCFSRYRMRNQAFLGGLAYLSVLTLVQTEGLKQGSALDSLCPLSRQSMHVFL
jgi:hypothetical protein